MGTIIAIGIIAIGLFGLFIVWVNGREARKLDEARDTVVPADHERYDPWQLYGEPLFPGSGFGQADEDDE